MNSTSPVTPAAEVPGKIRDYIVLDFLGEGAFGAVAKCFHPQTLEVVAVKLLKDAQGDLENEVEILQDLSQRRPDQANIARFIEHFTSRDSKCMVFEMLDCSLLEVMKKRQAPFCLSEIRPLAQQLLVAFDALKSAGIVHADLKPDNIMLVNHNDQPLKVRLIDFGCAFYTCERELESVIQPLEYRAPEVALGLPPTEALDMWSLGCTLGECYLGCQLFSGACNYNQLRCIIGLLGPLANALLDRSPEAKRYFVEKDGRWKWALKSQEEYESTTGKRPLIEWSQLVEFSDLETAIKEYSPAEDPSEYRDRVVFLDLLKQLLNPDPEKRITPREALQHPFITMGHLAKDNSQYAQWARDLMALTQGGSWPAPDSAEGDAGTCPDSLEQDFLQCVAAASERPGSALDNGDCRENGRQNPSEALSSPSDEGPGSSGRHDLRPSDRTPDHRDHLQTFVEIDDRINVDFTDDPALRGEEVSPDDRYMETAPPQTETVSDLGQSERETADNCDFVIDMEDSPGAPGSEAAGSGSSFWRWCKGAAFGGLAAVQGLLCYTLSGSALLTGAVLLPAALWGSVDVFSRSDRAAPQQQH